MFVAAGKDANLKKMERIAMTSMSFPAMMDSIVKHLLLYMAHIFSATWKSMNLEKMDE